jgi:hypothetical protein
MDHQSQCSCQTIVAKWPRATLAQKLSNWSWINYDHAAYKAFYSIVLLYCFYCFKVSPCRKLKILRKSRNAKRLAVLMNICEWLILIVASIIAMASNSGVTWELNEVIKSKWFRRRESSPCRQWDLLGEEIRQMRLEMSPNITVTFISFFSLFLGHIWRRF